MHNQNNVCSTFISTVLCVLFSSIFYKIRFDDFFHPSVLLVILGFTGAITLALLKQKRYRDVIYRNILVLFLVTIIILKKMPVMTILIFLIYFAALLVAIYVHARFFENQTRHLPMARSLILAALNGIFYVAANFVHGLLYLSEYQTHFLLGNLPVGFFIGLGIGLSVEICEKYSASSQDL